MLLKQNNASEHNNLMDAESYRVKSAINEVTVEILKTYDENGGLSSEEVRKIVAAALEDAGGEKAMGSQMLWTNFVKKHVMETSLISLGISSK